MNISLSKVIDGYFLAANTRRLSMGTIRDYSNTFGKFEEFLGPDSPMGKITAEHIRGFLAAQRVSKKTLLNYHIGLSALWIWALNENLVHEHTVRKVSRPGLEKKEIKPYSETDIWALLNALQYSTPYHRPGKQETTHRLGFEERNRALILLLVDTGIRALELCEIKIHHVDLKGRYVRVMGNGVRKEFCHSQPEPAKRCGGIWPLQRKMTREILCSSVKITGLLIGIVC